MEAQSINMQAARHVPQLWEQYNWERPWLALVAEGPHCGTMAAKAWLNSELVSGFDISRLAKRRSANSSDSYEMPAGTFSRFLVDVYRGISEVPGMFATLALKNVNGWHDGTYRLMTSPRHMIPTFHQSEDMQELIQGQLWALGDGLGICIGFDSSTLTGSDVDRNRQYLEILVQCGRIGQLLTVRALKEGLSTRMTPAIHESTGQRIFGLAPEEDIIYYLRVAREKVDPRV